MKILKVENYTTMIYEVAEFKMSKAEALHEARKSRGIKPDLILIPRQYEATFRESFIYNATK